MSGTKHSTHVMSCKSYHNPEEGVRTSVKVSKDKPDRQRHLTQDHADDQ